MAERGESTRSTPNVGAGRWTAMFIASTLTFLAPATAFAAAVWAIDGADSLVVYWVAPDGQAIVYKDIGVSPPTYFSWSTVAGHLPFDLIPGQDEQLVDFSDDGTVALVTLPDPAPATTRSAHLWTQGVGLTASLPAPPSGGNASRSLSGDGTTVLVAETVPGTGGDPDDHFVWTWSAAQGYTLVGQRAGETSGRWAWISDDGTVVLFYIEVAPDDFDVVRWTATGGAVSIPGLDGKLGIADFSGDGLTLVGNLDYSPLVWTVGSGIVDLGPIDVPWLTIPRFAQAISDDGVTASGEYLDASDVSDIKSLPFLWSAQDGYTLVFDALAEQGMDMRWPMGPLALISDLSDDGLVSAGYADLNGSIDWYYMIYDLDPAQIATETATFQAGLDRHAELLGLGLVNGSVSLRADELTTGGTFTASYRSLRNEELGTFVPDAAALDALIGPQRAVDAWTFASTATLAPGSTLLLLLEYSSRLPDASALALTAYVHDGAEWLAWPLAENSPSTDRARVELDFVPQALVLAPPPIAVPIGPLAATLAALACGALALRRLHAR